MTDKTPLQDVPPSLKADEQYVLIRLDVVSKRVIVQANGFTTFDSIVMLSNAMHGALRQLYDELLADKRIITPPNGTSIFKPPHGG